MPYQFVCQKVLWSWWNANWVTQWYKADTNKWEKKTTSALFSLYNQNVTSIFSSPEQRRSRSSPVPVPDIADMGSGENLVHHQNEQQYLSKPELKNPNNYWTSNRKDSFMYELQTYESITVLTTEKF